jgi:hypothetical protein
MAYFASSSGSIVFGRTFWDRLRGSLTRRCRQVDFDGHVADRDARRAEELVVDQVEKVNVVCWMELVSFNPRRKALQQTYEFPRFSINCPNPLYSCP